MRIKFMSRHKEAARGRERGEKRREESSACSTPLLFLPSDSLTPLVCVVHSLISSSLQAPQPPREKNYPNESHTHMHLRAHTKQSKASGAWTDTHMCGARAGLGWAGPGWAGPGRPRALSSGWRKFGKERETEREREEDLGSRYGIYSSSGMDGTGYVCVESVESGGIKGRASGGGGGGAGPEPEDGPGRLWIKLGRKERRVPASTLISLSLSLSFLSSAQRNSAFKLV